MIYFYVLGLKRLHKTKAKEMYTLYGQFNDRFHLHLSFALRKSKEKTVVMHIVMFTISCGLRRIHCNSKRVFTHLKFAFFLLQ